MKVLTRGSLIRSGIYLVLGVFILLFYIYGRSLWHPVMFLLRGQRTVADAVERYGPAARARLAPEFSRAGVPYPPTDFELLVFKAERSVELWAQGAFIRSYKMTAFSGTLGPKLAEGDGQIPEGFYRIVGLNPNSSFHLSMELDYPNAADRARAAAEGRTRLGQDIFVHGMQVSIGCVAVGNPAIEELFVLAVDAGLHNAKVTILPFDFFRHPQPPRLSRPWVAELYRDLSVHLKTRLRPIR